MNGIYEISNLGDWTPAKHPVGCTMLDVTTQPLAGYYNQAAKPATTDVTLTPPPAINLDGSDMVRMSLPDTVPFELRGSVVSPGHPYANGGWIGSPDGDYVPALLKNWSYGKAHRSPTRVTLGDVQAFPITYCTIPDVIG